MKTPPLLLGMALLFWGWQTDLIWAGAAMAGVLEGSRFIKLRWDLGDDDFKRIWTFCALLFLAAAVFAFADSGASEGFGKLFHGPSVASEREAGLASARTAASLIRWVPMIFFLFVAAQAYSSRQEIPLHTISLILQRRWKQAKRLGKPPPAARGVDVAYPYFAVVLFAASVHKNENNNFFWGLCALLGWALWVRRPRRFGLIIWSSALALAIVFGYSGARGMGVLQRYVESVNLQWIIDWMGRDHTDPSQSRTQIGQIGRIKTSTRIVIRLQPKSGQPPDYLREASYRTYKAGTWFADKYKNDFLGLEHATTNENTWPLEADKTNASRIGIACYLDGHNRKTGNALGLLPMPSGSERLEGLPAYVLQKNSVGAVLAEGPGLIQFDALYGPGLTIDSPPETNVPVFMVTNADFPVGVTGVTIETNSDEFHFHHRHAMAIDLEVPTNEMPALEQVAAELGLKGQSHAQARETIGQFFATKFTYRMWQDSDLSENNNETPLSRFLLKTRAGHCEYFATATVLLLREVGIPARYAVGYSVHEAGWDGYVVRQRDAHAWCLIWNDEKKIWEDFDTTPGAWMEVEERNNSSTWLSDAWSWGKFQLARLRWGQTRLREYILIGLVPVLALLAIQIIRQRRRQRAGKGSDAARTITWPGLDSEFYQIEKQLAQRGVPRGTNEAFGDWLERAAAEPTLAELKDPLRALLRLHYRYRFDPEGLGGTDREELRRRARECLDKLSRTESAPAA